MIDLLSMRTSGAAVRLRLFAGAAALSGWCALSAAPSRALADETISDPELAPPSQPAKESDKPETSNPSPRADHEVISDPELAGSQPPPQPVAASSGSRAAPSDSAGTTTWRVALQTRWGVDTAWDRPNQDVVGGTTIGLIEAQQRTSRSILFSVGLRARHGFGTWKNGMSHEELDVQPVSGFVDARLADGLHLRAGYQVVALGRFDLFSATDFLAVRDLRSGPFTMPDASAIAQPAIVVDYDATRSLSLEGVYLPFFEPDVVALAGTDYALLSPFYRVSTRVNGQQVFPDTMPQFGRSAEVTTSTSALGAFGPPPDFRQPQGALRATLHGTSGEIAATVGTALERLPAVSQALVNYAANPATAPVPQSLLDYGRFYVASVDGATDLGPIQAGFEAALMKDRVIPLVDRATVASVPTTTFGVQKVDMAQVGLRAEYAAGDDFGVGVEMFAATPLEPSLPAGESWLFFRGSRGLPITSGAALGGFFAPERSKLRFELGAIVATGLSYVVFPRVEWEALTRFYLELGAGLITGPGTILSPNPSIGGVYRDAGQVFTGVRWIP